MKYKLVVLTCILSIFIFAGCGNSNNKSYDKIVNENNITSLRIHNIKGEFKDVKSESDIKKIISIINGVKVIKSNVELKDGVGYGVEITYSDGKKEGLSFSGTFLVHNNKYYEVDKDIVNELKSIYDKI